MDKKGNLFSSYSEKEDLTGKLERTLDQLESFYNKGLVPNEIHSPLQNTLNLCMRLSQSFRHKVIVLGSNKNGKSSLINMLLRKHIIPTSNIFFNKWPLIIRNSDNDIPELYSAKLNGDYYYDFIEDKLLAEGNSEIIDKLNSINSSKEMDKDFTIFSNNFEQDISNNLSGVYTNKASFDNPNNKSVSYLVQDIINESSEQNKFNSFKKFTENKHSQFVFILKIKLESSKEKEFEIWELPNCTNQAILKELILKQIIQNEININQFLPIKENLQIKRLSLIYLSDFSGNNNLSALELHKNLIEHCDKIFVVVNKTDQLNPNNLERLVKINENKTFNNTVSFYYLSSLYSFLEYCEDNKINDDYYWSALKEFIYDANLPLKKEYKTFQEYKESILKNASFSEKEKFYLTKFEDFELDLFNTINNNKFVKFLEDNYQQIIKFHIFENSIEYEQSFIDSTDLISNCKNQTINKLMKNKNINAGSKKYNINPSLENIQGVFSFYFKKLKQLIKFEFEMLKTKLNKQFENVRQTLDDYIKNISIFSKEKLIRLMEIYESIIKSLADAKDDFKKKILKENQNLNNRLEKELMKLKMKPKLIYYFLNQIETEIKTEVEDFNKKFTLRGSDFLKDIKYAISNGILNGTIAFLGTKCIETLVNYKGASLGVFSSTFLCIIIGLGCLVYCTYKEFDSLNEKNKENFIEGEKELWEKVIKYREEIIVTLKQFASSTKNSIKACNFKINGLFSFLKKAL